MARLYTAVALMSLAAAASGQGSVGSIDCVDGVYDPRDGAPLPGAAPVLVGWKNPSSRVDGTDLMLGEIAHTAIMWAASPAKLEATPPAQQLLVPGPMSCARVYVEFGSMHFAARSIDTDGRMSELSNVAAKDVTNDPAAPAEIAVELWLEGPLAVGSDTSAYAFFGSRDAITTVWVGNVPPGTPCDPTQGVNGLYVVPRSLVNLDVDGDGVDDSAPEAVVARCLRD